MNQTLASIMGDSISTYSGYNPKGYEVYYEFFAQHANRMRSVHDTWWSIVLKEQKAKLCVNGSYSGSLVSGEIFPAAESEERIEALHKNGVFPDVIMVYIGFNDFGCAINITKFSDAYSHMLDQLKSSYPDAKIVCGTLIRTYLRDKPEWTFPEINRGVRLDDYNDAIRSACAGQGVYLADTTDQEVRYETLDGTHPTRKGHSEIAMAWNACLRGIV